MNKKNILDSHLYQFSICSVAKNLPPINGRFLITGASGLIGSCLIDILMAAKYYSNSKVEIIAVGRNKIKLEHRFYHYKNNEFHILEQDVCHPINIDQDLDYIIHAASNADPRSYALYPAETIVTNIYGTKNILDLAKQHSSRVLFTSTFEIYGRQHNTSTYIESYSDGILDFNHLRSAYPESKRCSELLCNAYYDEYHVDSVIARLSSIYGPTMHSHDNKAHAQFIRNAVNGENIILKSSGSQKRSYTYVIDAVTALLTVLFKGTSGEKYNISNEHSIASIAQVAQLAAKAASTSVKFDIPTELEKKGFSKPQDSILNNQKLKSLGWNASYSLERGLSESISILKELSS